MDEQLLVFRRQYLQLFEPDFLLWPPKALLKNYDVQAWLYENLFNEDKIARLPPERYQVRVLKELVSRIEKAIEDPEEDEISDQLVSHLSTLIASNLPSEATAVQQKTYVTFACLRDDEEIDPTKAEPGVTLLERRHLISGSKTTGFRTWEAALHLGSFLLTSQGAEYVRDRNILELGAGTGFLSILCAKLLSATHVTSTDGDEGVVEALKENAFLNGVDEGNRLQIGVLRWGWGLKDSWIEDDLEQWPYDTVLGADITYDKVAISALVVTLRSLFRLRPMLRVLISGAIRNQDTFDHFIHTCAANKFQVQEIEFEAPPIRQQTAMFYATLCPLKIISIRPPSEGV